MVHLHVHSWFSFLAGGSSPEALVARAKELGHRSLALTDLHGVYGAVRFASACRAAGIRPVFGATLLVGDPPRPLVFLARDSDGYEVLCRLAGFAHGRDRLHPVLHPDHLAQVCTERLFCLTGGPEGHMGVLLHEGRPLRARQWLSFLAGLFPRRLYVELAHRLHPDDGPLLQHMVALARDMGLPLVATNGVRYATPDDFALYDALTCVRLGLTVGDGHPERPCNDRAFLAGEGELRKRIPFPEAFANSEAIATQCSMDLLPGEVTPPTALLPEGTDAATHLRELCLRGLEERYPPHGRPRALGQLEHELQVVVGLDLSEFFLVVHEVVSFARSRRIRHAGRGSAANSIIAYCLRITNVDPIAHHLLFERFLHRGRKGMPDIDVDFDSERRLEVIDWMEARFGADHTAMTANVNTYRARGAVREMMKVLGWDLDTIDRVTRTVGHHDSMTDLSARRADIEAITGPAPMLDVLFRLVPSLRGCPRHLSLHNSGMILSRTPLARHSPVQTSANGVRQVQFDKDDVEALGLIKFDVLGLRMLAVISEALNLHELDTGERIPLDDIPMDDGPTFELIRRGQTMSVFQIESPGQWNLLSRTQPRTFDDLVAEVALFRPGPLQGGMVNPYVERRAGRQRITFPHPSLRPILADTCGIILYQEQVLEVSHAFAGMSLEAADRFRTLMSKWRDPGEMESMRQQFVEGAMTTHGVSLELAEQVFSGVRHFVGYGFCRSHAAAFAQIVYQSAYLKAHYPAAYMAAVLQHQPGFYPMSTVLEEVKHLGVPILPVDAWRSGARWRLEGGAIRIPLGQVKGMSDDLARILVSMREGCRTLVALRRRVEIPVDAWDALARAGAFDHPPREEPSPSSPAPGAPSRRDALWQLGLLRRVAPETEQPELFDLPVEPALTPELAQLREGLLIAWDFDTTAMSPRRHPVALHRARLAARGVERIQDLQGIRAGRQVRVAGMVVTLQRPPTAKGMTFIVLEDESARLPVAVVPQQFERLRKTLRSATLVVEGRLEEAGPGYRSVLVHDAWTLPDFIQAPSRP